MTDSQIVARYNRDARTILSPVSATPTITWAPQLVFSPGYYQYNSSVYDLTQPGLHVLTHYSTPAQPFANTTHMIVPDPSGDPTVLISAAGWLSACGTSDDALTVSQLSTQARNSKLRLLCGPLCAWTKQALLDPAGAVSRVVQFLTVSTPNNFADGHQTLEVKIGGNWALHDVWNRVRFKDTSGNLLSADSAVGAIASGSFSYDPLALGGSAAEIQSGPFDATSYYDSMLGSPGDMLAWHQHIFCAIGIQNGSQVWWKLPPGAPPGAAAYITGLSSAFVIKDAATWNAAFY